MVLLLITAGGMLVIFIISCIFYKHQDRRVVRGSGQDMMAIILGGCLLGYTGILTFIAHPGKGNYRTTLSPLYDSLATITP